MYKKNCNTRKWMYLCAVTGVMNLLAFIVCLYFQQWFISGIALPVSYTHLTLPTNSLV